MSFSRRGSSPRMSPSYGGAAPLYSEGPDSQDDPGQMSPRSALRAELEQQLQEPDAIMESGAFQMARKYIMDTGVSPHAAIESLKEGYVGYAAMANAMCSWMREMDRYGDGPTKFYRARQGAAPFGSSSRASPVPGAAHPSPTVLGAGLGAAAGGAARGNAAGEVVTTPDDFVLLSELLLEKFDGLKFLTSFQKGQPPSFMEGLLMDRRGRQLVYDLCKQHEHTALLNWAISKIVAQGLSEEVAAAGVSLSGYFSVFHQMLVNRLAKINSAPSLQQLQRLSQEIQDACMRSEHTYMYAQLLLQQLAEAEAVSALQQAVAGHSPGGGEGQHEVAAAGLYRRIAQDVDEALIRQGMGAKVWALQPLLLPRDASPVHSEAVHLVCRLLSTCYSLGGTTAPSNSSSNIWGSVKLEALKEPKHAALLQQLLQVYTADGADCAPLQPLRQRYCLDLLLAAVFSGIVPASPQLPAPVVRNCQQLLGLAVAGEELWQLQEVVPDILHAQHQEQQPGARSRSKTPVPAQGPSTAAAAAAAASDGRPPDTCRRVLVGLDTSSVAEAAAMLAAAQDTGRVLMRGIKLGDAEQRQMQFACCLKVGALGLVRLARVVLGKSDHYSEENCNMSFPWWAALLEAAGQWQPGLVPQVLACCRDALLAMGRDHGQYAAALVDLLVQLLLAGHVEGVCTTMQTWASQAAEPSLLRAYIVRVISEIAPPYSPEFAGSMLWLMMHSNIDRAINFENRRQFQQFAEDCTEVNFPMPLSTEQQAMLDHLRG